MEAKELLGNRTPTTALEALALQNQAEITAESMFYGVEYNLNVKDRFKEIEREVQAIARWFNPRIQKRSEINARLTIIESLAKRFREMNQFEEEMMCLAEARKLRFEFWMRQKPWRWAAWPFLKYLDLALYSLPRFLFLLLFWVVFFGLIYYIIAIPDKGFWDAFTSSTMFFFTMESAKNWDTTFDKLPILWNAIKATQGFLAFFNLSLLFAHIYMIVTRR